MKYYFDKKEHLHLLDNKPLTGTSSVGDVLAKPLTWWASGLAVQKFGWLNPKKHSEEEVEKALTEGHLRVVKMTKDEYKSLLDEAYRAHSIKLKDSATSGKDLHAELERYIKDCMKGNHSAYDKKIEPFIDWSRDVVKEFLWSEAHCYDEDLWVGGISDAGAKLIDGQTVLIDFKSSKEAYPTQFIQCAGYALQIEKNGLFTEDGQLIKKIDKIDALIVVPFGAEIIEPQIRYDLENYKTGFKSAVQLYRLLGLENANK